MSVICDSCGFLGCDGACPEGYLYIIERKDDEIERLNAIIRFAAGYISTTDGWTDRHPQECFDWLMEQTGEVES
jgi:hypothetical protein